jgi:hypothetical protein
MKSFLKLIIINLILIACPVMLVAGGDWKLITQVSHPLNGASSVKLSVKASK